MNTREYQNMVIDDFRSHLSKAFGPAKVIKKTSGLYRSKRFHCQLLLPLSIAIVSLVIGPLYLHDCPVQPRIPIYLTVQGSIGLFIFVIHLIAIVYILHITEFKYHFIVVIAFLAAFLILFLFVWFILGNVWVFNAANDVQFTDKKTSSSYCNGTLFRAAFGLIIAVYAMSVFFCCSLTWIPQSSQSPTNGIIKVRKQIPKIKQMFNGNNEQPVSTQSIIETRF